LVADSRDVSHFTERAACIFIGQAMTSPSQSTPGRGSAPALHYAGRCTAEESRMNHPVVEEFSSHNDYARRIIDQHLSLVLWPGECVIQDMHLDFGAAQIIPLTCTEHSIRGLDFMTPQIELIDSFAVKALQVFLDDVYVWKQLS
jgi:hypothetical protein